MPNPEPQDRDPQAEAAIAAIRAAYQQGKDDLEMVIALYRQKRGDTEGDPLLGFALVEAMLAEDGMSHKRALRALAFAARNVVALEEQIVRLGLRNQ